MPVIEMAGFRSDPSSDSAIEMAVFLRTDHRFAIDPQLTCYSPL
jgi:hypothetical protein